MFCLETHCVTNCVDDVTFILVSHNKIACNNAKDGEETLLFVVYREYTHDLTMRTSLDDSLATKWQKLFEWQC